MNERKAIIEISPSTIHFTECSNCHGELYAFTMLALSDNAIAEMDGITRCTACMPN